jgi:uncharacterized protein
MTAVFPCTGCGACCRSVRFSPLTTDLDRGDGVCRHLNDIQNSCTIYENRPDICNIQRTYEQQYKSTVSWPKFITLNLVACQELLSKK